MSVLFVDTPQQLADLCAQLSGSSWLAIDTEFHRERTYHAQLCLIQIANDEVIACVDPLALADLSPLLELLYQPDITLVFHAARQDLELFYLLKNALPQNIFDTQLAATVLGYGDQIGYGNLVKQCLDIELDKAHARTDWRTRPLSQAQIDYAADDVRYLRTLYHQLSEKLAETGRMSWLADDFTTLSSVATYVSEPDSSWKKVKGAGRLKPQQLAILQQLASWRESRALDRNLPRKWVLKDDVMLDLARLTPNTLDKLAKIRGLEKREVDRYGQKLLELIAAGKQVPAEQWPTITKPKPLSNQEDALSDALMAILRKVCDEKSITPIAVASRKDIEALIRGEDTPVKHGWRNRVVGQQLQDFLAGRTHLQVEASTLTIHQED